MTDARYTEIETRIRESYPNACILYIDEVINPELEARYQARKLILKEEVRGFHGTKESTVPQIIVNGFDPSYNVRSVYGPGVYFANEAQYSSVYMFASRPGEPTFMFLADVLMGTKGVDNHIGPDIFTTVHADGAFPRYMIAFHKEAR